MTKALRHSLAPSAALPAAKKIIVVCGYPKSGTTWLSRLVAELVACPLLGDFGFADGVLPEGRERESDYVCYKSHYTRAALAAARPNDELKIVYVVRDPRDVVISAAHHFRVNLVSLRSPHAFIAAMNRRLGRLLPHAMKRRRLIEAVLNGNASLSPWLAVSWRDHYRAFRQTDSLVLKYEDVLADPRANSLAVLAFLGLARSSGHVETAVAKQSFDEKKKYFESQGLAAERAFLRRGGHGYWRSELSREQQALFAAEVGEELRELGYPLG